MIYLIPLDKQYKAYYNVNVTKEVAKRGRTYSLYNRRGGRTI